MQEGGAMSVELRNSFWFSLKACILHLIWATYMEELLPKGSQKKTSEDVTLISQQREGSPVGFDSLETFKAIEASDIVSR